MEKKTHRVNKHPEIPVQYLADYMAASNQARRGIVQKSKYKSLARTFQHQLARKALSDHILDGNPLPGDLTETAEEIRARIADSEFEEQLHGHNADFVKAFADVSHKFNFCGFEVVAPEKLDDPSYNGTTVRFRPSLLCYRMTKANTQKIGGLMYRYAKGTPVGDDAAQFQSAFIYGFFRENPFIEESKPEFKLCQVLCAVSGKTHIAPSNSVYKFNEMKAVCNDIAEKWENIPPPTGAVI